MGAENLKYRTVKKDAVNLNIVLFNKYFFLCTFVRNELKTLYMVTKFYSKKSILFFILILIIPAILIFYLKIKYGNDSYFFIFVLLLITLLNLYMFFFTYYVVNNDKLIIKIGFFTYKSISLKDIKDIKDIKDDKTIRRSLSTSENNRIEIFYGETSLIISPKNKIEFLKKINFKKNKL